MPRKEIHKAIRETEVANGQDNTAHVGHGEFSLLTRYGNPGH